MRYEGRQFTFAAQFLDYLFMAIDCSFAVLTGKKIVKYIIFSLSLSKYNRKRIENNGFDWKQSMKTISTTEYRVTFYRFIYVLSERTRIKKHKALLNIERAVDVLRQIKTFGC